MTSFKKSFVKPFARPNELYTVEDSYWKKLTVSTYLLYVKTRFYIFLI